MQTGTSRPDVPPRTRAFRWELRAADFAQGSALLRVDVCGDGPLTAVDHEWQLTVEAWATRCRQEDGCDPMMGRFELNDFSPNVISSSAEATRQGTRFRQILPTFGARAGGEGLRPSLHHAGSAVSSRVKCPPPRDDAGTTRDSMTGRFLRRWRVMGRLAERGQRAKSLHRAELARVPDEAFARWSVFVRARLRQVRNSVLKRANLLLREAAHVERGDEAAIEARHTVD